MKRVRKVWKRLLSAVTVDKEIANFEGIVLVDKQNEYFLLNERGSASGGMEEPVAAFARYYYLFYLSWIYLLLIVNVL